VGKHRQECGLIVAAWDRAVQAGCVGSSSAGGACEGHAWLDQSAGRLGPDNRSIDSSPE
jgi:hypothetical protein